MIPLLKTIKSWEAPGFTDILKDEIESLDAHLLPLQEGMALGSHVGESQFSVMILHVSEEAGIIFAKVGIFFTSVIAGCNCADDPTSIDEQTEYCEVQFEIDRETAEAKVRLLE